MRGMLRQISDAAQVRGLAEAHQPVIDRCEAAVRGALAAGRAVDEAIDSVFDDHHLWHAFHAQTGQPQE